MSNRTTAHPPSLLSFRQKEFSKEVDAKSSLRSSVLSTGNQLLRLKRVNTSGLRSALAQVDTQWAELLTRIPVVQEKLHQIGHRVLLRAGPLGEDLEAATQRQSPFKAIHLRLLSVNRSIWLSAL